MEVCDGLEGPFPAIARLEGADRLLEPKAVVVVGRRPECLGNALGPAQHLVEIEAGYEGIFDQGEIRLGLLLTPNASVAEGLDTVFEQTPPRRPRFARRAKGYPGADDNQNVWSVPVEITAQGC